MNRDGPLVLIEPYAHRPGGHHQCTLIALGGARPSSLVIAPQGLAADPNPLRQAHTSVVTGPATSLAAVLLASARAAAWVSTAGQKMLASRRWPLAVRRAPHQVTLVARCLTEAACLRTARRLEPEPAAVVVLSASEALHGAAALLGTQPHLRFVHEAVTTEDLPLRLLGWLTRQGENRVRALYPTAAVRDQLAPIFPRLRGAVRAFSVDDGHRLTGTDRDDARAAFDIPADATAICVVGGWWPYKDIDTIDAALIRVNKPLHLIVCGTPLDESVLARWCDMPDLRLHTVPGPVGEQVLRMVYAAADAALVARRPGVGKESGLVMDAVRLGVPLIVSDHDPGLAGRLSSRPWAWLYPAGDPNALAATLDRLASGPPNRPGPEAPKAVGMSTAAEQATFLTDTYTRLLSKER